MICSLTLPYPPSINHYYCRTRFGGMAVSKKGKDYRKKVWAMVKQKYPNIKISKEVIVCIYLFPPDKRKRDIDNVLKCLLDSLQDSGIIENDNLITTLLVHKKKTYSGEVVVWIEDADDINQELLSMMEDAA